MQERSEAFRISETVRDINAALVAADTRADLEDAVCSTLAAADPYVFAWIGEYDTESDAVVPNTYAGVSGGYLETLDIHVRDEATRDGPTAQAIRTGTIEVVQNIETDPDYEPWRDAALERGYRSSAAVPLQYDGTSYGVLNVYSDRHDAFGPTERELFADLGDTIANALDGIDARTQLERQKAKYERLTTRISDAFYAVDTDWTITYWNDRMAARTEVSADEAIGATLWDLFPEITETEAGRRYRRAMTSGKQESFETFLEDPFNYWVEVDVYPDDEGLSIFSREVTERKEYERRLEAVIENTSNPIYLKDRDGTYRLANEATARLFGLDPEEVVGKTDRELFDATSADDIEALDREILETGRPDTRETTQYIDGREHAFIDNKFPYRDATGEVVGVMGVSHDITGRTARERELRSTKQRLDLALAGTDTGVWERDLDTGDLIWDETTERLFGLEPGTFEGTDEAFLARVHPADRDRVAAAAREAVSGDGDYEVEYRIECDDGTDRWVHAQGQIPADGDADRMIGIVTDITERKEYERRLEEQNEKLELLNRIIRHDIRNDMQVVMGLAEVIEASTTGDTADYAERILDTGDHVVELTRIARDLMRAVLDAETSREPTPLAATLEDELDDVRQSYDDADVRVENQFPRVDVYADDLLGSVFRNLLKNAVQHNDADDPSLRVSTTETADAVIVHVADDGPGIPDDRKESIFGKGERGLESQGTGIGLYLVNTLVESYDGEVRVEDRSAWDDGADDTTGDGDQTGTVFHVRLQKAV